MAEDNKNLLLDEDSEIVDEEAPHSKPTDDEASLSDALNTNGFKLFFFRNFIKLKNHLTILPMIVVVLAMVIFTCTLIYHDAAVNKLICDDFNAFLLFVNVLASIMLILIYMQATSRKSSQKKRIFMHVLFYAVVALELWIDFRYIHYFDVQTSLVNNIIQITEDSSYSLANSRFYTLFHAILLIVATVLSILAPILQPFTKKIHIKVK